VNTWCIAPCEHELEHQSSAAMIKLAAHKFGDDFVSSLARILTIVVATLFEGCQLHGQVFECSHDKLNTSINLSLTQQATMKSSSTRKMCLLISCLMLCAQPDACPLFSKAFSWQWQMAKMLDVAFGATCRSHRKGLRKQL